MRTIEIGMNEKEYYHHLLDTQFDGEKIISYGISQAYVPNWTEQNALVEYIANFYDENGTNFILQPHEEGIRLIDQSTKGIELKDLVVGNSQSSKTSTKIGTHGEGFKLGALVFARNNKAIVIETIGNTIVFYMEYEQEFDTNVLKSKVIPNDRKIGTQIYIETNELNSIKERFLFLNENLGSTDKVLCPNLTTEGNYIYINTMANASIRSRHSYSIKKKLKTNRDRTIIENKTESITKAMLDENDAMSIRHFVGSLIEDDDTSFEHEMMCYIAQHFRRKDMRERNYNLFHEASNYHEILFVPPKYCQTPSQRKLIEASHLTKNIIFGDLRNEHKNKFFSEVLKSEIYNSQARTLFNPITNYTYYFDHNQLKPIDTIARSIITIIDNSKTLGLLKTFKLENNKVVLELKNLTNIDYINLKIKNKDCSYLLKELAIPEYWGYYRTNWENNIISCRDYVQMDFAPLPSNMEIQLSEDICLELSKNLMFIPHKQIVRNKIYKLEGKQYEFDYAFNLMNETDSLFSYIEGVKNDYSIISSQKFWKEIFININSKNPRPMDMEMDIIRLRWHSYRYQIKQGFDKAFISLYGRRAKLDYDNSASRLAAYNGHTLIKANEEILHLAKDIDSIAIPNQNNFAEVGEFDLIPKPKMDFNEYMHSPYGAVLKAGVLLELAVQNITNIIDDPDETPLDSLYRELVPGINNIGFKYETKKDHYIFEILEKTHVVEKFQENLAGLNRGDSIYLKNSEGILGTFMHEYVHLSTNLNDINTAFEKCLAFLGLLMKFNEKNLSHKNIHDFFKRYTSYIGGKK